VTTINCDFEGPVLKEEFEPFEMKEVRDYRTPFKTVDVSSYFRPINSKCAINGFMVAKVANIVTKVVEDVDYISIDKDGLLKIGNFETELEPSYIYVEASAGANPTFGKDSSYVGSLNIFPPKINKPPVFSPFLEPANIKITGADNEKFEIKFPNTKDPEGTKVTLEVIPPLPSFV
jgi:hypothetical protein